MSDVLSRLSAALSDRYLLERELGHGGMATVYLARDVKHRRSVAVKVLRPELAASLGSDRFLHEIEIAAQLQHPHILPLLDSGDAEGFLYYAMPYVQGESLRERLARTGEFPVSDAVRILVEIAEALAYAHGQGVVHRDMKPENIMLSGRHPLVMDFGIAKAVSPAGTTPQVTTEGVALGTPAYMAPEQAAADPHLDHRVDIYALGVIGYELLTGTTPFVGTSAQQILAAHMTQRPEPISTRRPTVPVSLGTMLMRCLEKRPADRPQSADEILQTLETIVTPGEGITPTGSRPVPALTSPTSRRALVLGGAILVAIVVGLLWRSQSRTSNPVVPRHAQLTFVGNVLAQEISPDGHFLAYVQGGEPDRLVVKDLRGGSTIQISTVGELGASFRWSPDGTSILFVGSDSSGKMMTAMFPRLGGALRRLDNQSGYGLLSTDGSQLAGWWQNVERPIVVTTLATGAKRKVTVPDSLGWLHDGDWSPRGASIALLSTPKTGDRWVLWGVDLETGEWQPLVSDTVPLSGPRWSPGEEALYYLRDRSELRKLAISADGLSRAVPEVVQTGLGTSLSGFSITADGRRLVYGKEYFHSNFWYAIKTRGNATFATRQLTQGTTGKTGGRFSPSGRFVAFIQGEHDRGDVFVRAIEGNSLRQVTSSGVAPVSNRPSSLEGVAWSPDESRLAYVAKVQGKSRIRIITLDELEERTFERTEVSQSLNLTWAPHERILYHRPGNRNFHWLDPATGVEEPLVTNDSVGWMFAPAVSPDRQRVAVFWNRKGGRGVYLISLRDGHQTPVGPARFNWPLGWSLDGTALYIQDESSRIRRISLDGTKETTIGKIPFKDADCDLAERPSALTLLCNVRESVSDVWVMEDFDPTSR